MLKQKLLKQKSLRREQGFTLTEVFIATLIMFAFVAASMQAMVIATVFKVRAKGFSEATNWIQEDLENVRNKAAQLQNTSLTDAVAANTSTTKATVLPVASTSGFEAGDSLIVGSINSKIATGGVNATAKTITLTAGATPALLASTSVVATTKCNAISETSGFASHLRNNLLPVVSEGTPASANEGRKRLGVPKIDEITGKPVTTGKVYVLTRDGPETGDNPVRPNVSATDYEVLKIKYEVRPQGGGDPIATMYTEVIPDAAYKCP